VEAGHQGGRLGGPYPLLTAAPRPDHLGVSPSSVPDVAGGAAGHDAAPVDHGDPVGQRLGLAEVVRRQHDAGLLPGQVPHHLPEAAPGLRIESGGRLVEEQQLWPADEAQGDVEAAALPARQGAHES
jgi:hypothetical protein